MGESGGQAYWRTSRFRDEHRPGNQVFFIALLVSLALHAATIMLAPGFRPPSSKIAQTLDVLLMPPVPQPAVVPSKPAAPAPAPETAAPVPEAVQKSPPPEEKVKPAAKPVPSPQKEKAEPAIKPVPPPREEKVEPHTPVTKPSSPKPEAPHRKREPPPRRKPAPVENRAAAPAAPPVSATTAPPEPAAQATPAPPPEQTQPPQPSIDDLLDRYGRNLARIVAKGQHYPRIAQMRGWQGTVEVEVTVIAPGKADNIAIRQSSGHQVLDEEALDMVKRALPLPPPPEPLRGRRFTVVVPIVFRLHN